MTTPNERHTFLLYPSRAEFDPFAPDWRLLQPEDMAHSLSSMARFGGNTPEPYMVGQHAVIVSERCEALAKRLRRQLGDIRMCGRAGLMHEIAESHSGFPDPIGPIKRHPMFRELFRAFCRPIEEAASVAWALPPGFAHLALVKAADDWAYAWENRDLRGFAPPLGMDLPAHTLVPWTWQECRQRFMDRWHLVKPPMLPAPRPDTGRGWE